MDEPDATETIVRTAGFWLAAGAALLLAALAMHPPPPVDDAQFMELIASEGSAWAAVHWMAAVALSLFVVAGLLVLSGRSRLTARPTTLSAWAILTVGALWTLATAVMEATAFPRVAAQGDLATFERWQSLAAGHAMGFAVLGLAVAVIAADAARRPMRLPRWSSTIAAVAGVAAFSGWMAGAADIPAGGAVWLVSSLVMNAWLVAFGVILARFPAPVPERRVAHA